MDGISMRSEAGIVQVYSPEDEIINTDSLNATVRLLDGLRDNMNAEMGIPADRFQITHTEIKAREIITGVWEAYCHSLTPLKAQVNMKGRTEQDAITKMREFFGEQ